MDVKEIIAEYNKNGTKNLINRPTDVSKTGALDSKQIANFFVEKIGGLDSFAKHYSQWGKEYNETQKQVSGIQDGYSSKDAMKDAAKKLKSLAASGSIYNYINTALGGKSTPNFAESLNKQINALEERSAFYSQWETEEEYNKWYKNYNYNLDDGVKTVTELSDSVKTKYEELKKEKSQLHNNIKLYHRGVRTTYKTYDEVEAAQNRISEIEKELADIDNGVYQENDRLTTEREDLANAVLFRLDELSADQLKTYAEAIGWHSTAITTDEGKEVTWKSLYDAKAEGERLDAVYKEKFADSPYTKYYEELLKWSPNLDEIAVLVDGEYKSLSGLNGLKTIIDHQDKIRTEKAIPLFKNNEGTTFEEQIQKEQEKDANLTPNEIIQKGIKQDKFLAPSVSDIEKELYTRSNGVPDWHYGINHELSNEELNFLKEFYEYKKEEGEFKTGHPYYETVLDRKKAQWSEWAMDNPVSASFGSLIDTFQGGVQGFLGNTASMITGNGIDLNASYNEPTLRAQTMRAAVAQTISNADYESWRKRNPAADYDAYSNLALTWGDVGSFAYMTGMSFADSMIAAGFGALTGGGNVLSLGIMGTSAANSTVLQKKEQGYTDEQAYALGIVSGLAEIVTEKYSLDALFSDGAKGAAYILKNFVTEGTEEGASYLINFVANTLLLTDESEWAKMVQGYRDQGFDESTAFWKSVGDVALQFGADMLGGALCGGFAGAGGTVINYGSAKAMGSNIKSKGLLDAVAELGLKSDNKTVLKYAKQLQSGVKLSDATIGNMVTEIFRDVETQTSEDITAALKRRGYNSSSAKEIGESLTKSIVGKSMTLGETRIAMKDAKAVEIAKTEVNTERASMLNGIYRIMTFDVSQLGVEFDDQPTTQTYSTAQPVSAQSESVQPAPVQNGTVAPSSTAAMGGTAPVSNENVSGLPASDVASPDGAPAANAPAAKQNSGVAPVANVDSVETGSDSTSPYDEPDLTDTSGLDTYDRVAQQMLDKPFIYTEQHKRVEQVAKKLGRNLYWDCKFGNGYIDANGDIHLAPDTKSPISKVFKHELTHFLQKNQQMYNRFANAVMDSQIFKDWVKSKGYNSNEAFANHIIETYQAAEQERQRTNPDAPEISIDEGKAYQEMLADFVGEKLFGGKNSVTAKLLNALEEGPRQSFVDTIRQWVAKVKSALKGTKEGKTIADFEQEFIAAYKAAQKTFDSEGTKNTAQADGQYDIGVLDNGNTYVIASRRVINGTTLKDQRADITAFFKKLLQNKPSLDIPTIEGDILTITMSETAYKARDNYKYVNGNRVKLSDDEFRLKLNVEAHIDEIAETSISNKKPLTNDGKNHEFAKDGFEYRSAYFEDFDGQYYKIDFSVGKSGTVATVYNVGKINGSVPSSAKLIAVVGSKALDGSLPNPIIRNDSQNVNKNSSTSSSNSNSQYSITIEAEYEKAVQEGNVETAQRLVNEVAERAMPNSKVRDTNGKLAIVYHGTEAEQNFYVFDKSRQGQTDSGLFGHGYYFTADYDYAEMFSEENPNNEPRAFFLNITNPFVVSSVSAPASEIATKLIDLGVSVDFDYTGLETQHFANKFGNQRFSDTLQALGYDGVIVEDGYECVAFAQNQMKSADAITYDDNGDVIPLEQRFDYGSNDVRYSIDVDSPLDKYTEKQYNDFGWVRYNDVASAEEYSALLSRYADYKHNKNQYPTTRFGEAVISSFDYPDLIMYIKGNIDCPEITKVVRINYFDCEEIRREILYNEQRQVSLPYKNVVNLYGQEILSVHKRRDYESFREYLARKERGSGQTSNNNSGKQQDGTRSLQQNKTTDRADSIDEPAFSNGEKDQYSLSVETAADLLEQYEQGKITKEEYLSRVSKQKPDNPARIAKLTPDDASTTPDFPETTDKGKQDGQSRFYSNVKEKAKFVSDTVKNMVTDDSFIKHYATITNKETLTKAAKKLDEGGAALVQEWATKDERNMTAEDISIGLILIERYQVEGNHSAVINVMRKMRKAGTIAGQTVQSFSLLGRLDPTSMQMYMQKELDEAYEAMVEGKTNKWIQANKSKYELTEEELDYIRRRALQAMHAADSRAKDIAIAEILAMVSNKIPPPKGMALKSLMRTSMLFNLKTQVRNVLGNVSMVPAHWASDLVGTAIDSITAKFTGYRTKGINIATRKNGEAFIRGAREAFEDYRLGIDTRQDLDRFDVGSGKAFNDQHSGISSIINPVSRVLNRIDRFNSFLLELGDRPFFEYWFTNSLENQMRLNGVTEPTAEMLEIAEQEALTRVWQDTNRFTKSVSTIKKILNSVNVRGYGLGDMFIKFVKTPANLTKAMVDFSPIGLVHGVMDIVKLNRSLETGIGNSKLLQSQMVKSLSNGIVGTLLYIAFYALAAGLVKGITVSGAPNDDDDVDAFNKEVLGRYPYTISIGDYSFSYDWMSPIGSMISTAKAVVDATESDKDMLTTTRHAIQASADVLFNQSFMQSLQEVFTNRDGYWAGIEQTVIDEPSVLIPQLVAQFASSLDEYQRETYQKDDTWQTMLNDVLYKLPWLRETLEPKLDALGREVANPRGDFFNAFLNPANTYVSNNTETAEEVHRLYESTGEASVMYPKAPRSVTVDGETHTLTIKERNQYQKTLGTISDRNIESLMRLGIYKEMTDADRAKTITDIYEYARAVAKSEYLGDDSTLSTKHKKIKALEDEGVISAAEYLMLTETSDTDGNNYLTNAELNRGLQTYIEDMRTRQFVKQLYRAKDSEIGKIIENYNN